jgi:hypothetical protein
MFHLLCLVLDSIDKVPLVTGFVWASGSRHFAYPFHFYPRESKKQTRGGDWNKLLRVLGFLKGTINDVLKLEAEY